MADSGIPPGLTIRKTKEEVALFRSVNEAIKQQADELSRLYENNSFLNKSQEKFQKNLDDDIEAKKKEHQQYLDDLREEHQRNIDRIKNQEKSQEKIAEELAKQTQINTKVIENREIANAKEIEKLRKDSFRNYQNSLSNTQKTIQSLKTSADKRLQSYEDFQKRMLAEIKQLKDAGASSEEISAYLKKNQDRYQEASKEMASGLHKIKDVMEELSNNDNLDSEVTFTLKRQLRLLEKSYDLEEARFTKQYKIFEAMNEDLNRLRESQEEADKKEKRQQKGKIKDTLITTMLGPFRLLTDPISQFLHNNRDTFEQLQHKTEQKEAKIEIYEKSRKELNKLAEEKRESERLAALMSGADADIYARPSIAGAGISAIQSAVNPLNILRGLTADLGLRESSFEEYSARENRRESIDDVSAAIKELPQKLLGGVVKGAWGAISGKTSKDDAYAVSLESSAVPEFAMPTFPAVEYAGIERRVGKECRSRWSPYH
jgi:DNA repair exonuclease SbcCD ATPase subunit